MATFKGDGAEEFGAATAVTLAAVDESGQSSPAEATDPFTADGPVLPPPDGTGLESVAGCIVSGAAADSRQLLVDGGPEVSKAVPDGQDVNESAALGRLPVPTVVTLAACTVSGQSLVGALLASTTEPVEARATVDVGSEGVCSSPAGLWSMLLQVESGTGLEGVALQGQSPSLAGAAA